MWNNLKEESQGERQRQWEGVGQQLEGIKGRAMEDQRETCIVQVDG